MKRRRSTKQKMMFADELLGPTAHSVDTTATDEDINIENPEGKEIESTVEESTVEEIIVDDHDSQLSFIQNFKVESDDEDFTNKDGLSLIEVQRKLYSKECEKYSVTPIRVIAELTPNLKHLDVAHFHLGPKGAMALSTPLHLDGNIITLDMQYNDIGPEGCQAIAEMLLDNNSITAVNLAHNNIGPHGLACVCRIFKSNISVVRLDLSGNRFCDTCSQYLPFLFTHPFIRELILSQNEFDILTAKTIGEQLAGNESLEFLDISWNHFRFNSADAIAKGIKENIGLKKLDISYNGFGSVGLVAMGNALAVNTSLQELDITHNRITDAGVHELCKSLRDNTCLTHLKIGGNVITQHAVTDLIHMIQKYSSSALVTLDIQDVFVDQVFLNLINDVKETRELFVTHGSLEKLEICQAKLMEAKQKATVIVAPPNSDIEEPQELQESEEGKQVSENATEEGETPVAEIERKTPVAEIEGETPVAKNVEEVAEIPKETKEAEVVEEKLSELQIDAAGDPSRKARFAD